LPSADIIDWRIPEDCWSPRVTVKGGTSSKHSQGKKSKDRGLTADKLANELINPLPKRIKEGLLLYMHKKHLMQKGKRV
jgi:hypothetical protein